jgi:hypothetical protein
MTLFPTPGTWRCVGPRTVRPNGSTAADGLVRVVSAPRAPVARRPRRASPRRQVGAEVLPSVARS